MKKLILAALGLVAFIGTAHASDLEHNQKLCDAFLRAGSVIDCRPSERGISLQISDSTGPSCGNIFMCSGPATQVCNQIVTKIRALSHHTYDLHVELDYNGGYANCGAW